MMLINRGSNIRNERDEMRDDNENVFERLLRHASQGHGITLSRAETKKIAERIGGLGSADGSDVWKAVRSHAEKIYRAEHQIDELAYRIRNLEERDQAEGAV